jgi:hypothetical protein
MTEEQEQQKEISAEELLKINNVSSAIDVMSYTCKIGKD